MFYWGKCDIKIIEKVTSGEIWKRGGREQMYVYYVVYEIMGKNYTIGKGSCICNLNRKITDYDAIEDVKTGIIKDIKEQYPNLDDVLITNFRLLRKKEK